eukprot:gene47713-64710_t
MVISGSRASSGAAEDDEIEQRVRAEAVGAVHRYAGCFADGHQARERSRPDAAVHCHCPNRQAAPFAVTEAVDLIGRDAVASYPWLHCPPPQ